MFINLIQLIVLICACAAYVTTPSTETLQDEVNSLKYSAKTLAVQLEKWNTLFLTTIEPRMASSGSLLSSIGSNINNLQERAHIWDTFQLHVSAWNDQLSTLDRKMDIISKGQEKLLSIDAKIDSLANLEYKVEQAAASILKMEETVSNLKEQSVTQKNHKEHDLLFGEFATRGILSTVKMVEKKLERLLIAQHNSMIKPKSEEKPKLTIKCNTPRVIEELLNDVSSKVDVIFDRLSTKEDNEGEIEVPEYEGSGEEDAPQEMREDYNSRLIKKVVKRMNKPCKKMNEPIEELLSRTMRIENTTRISLDKEDINLENTQKIIKKLDEKFALFGDFGSILGSYFSEQRASIESGFQKCACRKTDLIKNDTIEITTENSTAIEENFGFMPLIEEAQYEDIV